MENSRQTDAQTREAIQSQINKTVVVINLIFCVMICEKRLLTDVDKDDNEDGEFG